MDENNISISDKALEAISAGDLLSYEEFVNQPSQKDMERKMRDDGEYYVPKVEYKNYIETELDKLFPGSIPWLHKA